MKNFMFTLTLLSSTVLLSACDNIKKALPQAAENAQQPAKTQDKPSTPKIEDLVDHQVAETIKSLSSTDDQYMLHSKSMIKADLNHDGKSDYIVETSYCSKTDNCPMGTITNKVFVFTTDQQDRINFMTSLDLPRDAKVTNISKDGIITTETAEYKDTDADCCPSIIKTQSFALVGTKLALLADK